MPSITPPDHHLIPIQRPLPQAHMVQTIRVQEIVARVTATLRSSGSSHLVAFVGGWRVGLRSQCIHGSSSGFGSGHSCARLSSHPRSFAVIRIADLDRGAHLACQTKQAKILERLCEGHATPILGLNEDFSPAMVMDVMD